MKAVQSLYENVECSLRVNGHQTEWFSVKRGLKQGCLLSPLLFNLFVNELVEKIKALGLGVEVKHLTLCR